jgi:RND family efflux transporter MFP subunit
MNQVNIFLNLILLTLTVYAETPTESSNQAALTVSTINPQSTTWKLTVPAVGSLYAWQEAIIASEISGLRIVEVLADVGQKVKKGELLAILAQDTVEAVVAQRRAEAAQAKVVVSQAKAESSRALKAKGALSEQQLEQYVFAQERAQATFDAVTAVLRNEEIRLEKTRIYAVDDGIISSRNATLGAVVQTGSELFRLVRQNRIEWRAEVTAEHISQIKVKQTANVVLPDGNTVKGKVRVIAPTLEVKTRKALVYVDLSSSKLARVGMFVHGDILISTDKVLTLPLSAITLRDGFNYIFVVASDNKVEQRKISIGRVQEDRVEILTRLSKKTDVVLSGGAFLEDGDVVNVVQAK